MKSSAVSASGFVVLSLLGTVYGCSGDSGDADPNTGYGGGQQFVGAGGGIAAGGGAMVQGTSGGTTQVQTGTGGATVVVGAGGAVNAGGATGTAGAGAGGADPAAGGGPAAGGAPPSEPPPCITDQKGEVAIIGDSYVTGAASPALQPALAKIDPNASQYRNYAVAGTSMVSGGVTGFIPPQYDQAYAASKNTKLIIMDGGGNDVLICNALQYPGCGTTCNKAGSSQQKICTDIVAAALDGATKLMTKMADQGVKDVIYFYYPHIPASGGGYAEILDYAEPLAKKSCDDAYTRLNGKLRCHWVSSMEAFKAAGGDKNPANFAGDGIHPSAAGQDIMAKLIEDRMKADCVGQASGCCQSGG